MLTSSEISYALPPPLHAPNPFFNGFGTVVDVFLNIDLLAQKV